jgi:hypothetical protein
VHAWLLGVQDRRQRWDVAMLHKAAMGAAVLHMRETAFLSNFFAKAIPDNTTELASRPALALLDLLFGAQRRPSHSYVPSPTQRRAIVRGILPAASKRERRWTAFECWQICRMLQQLDPEADGHLFTRIVSHTVWSEHTQLRQGTYEWEVVLADPTLFTSRIHALLKAGAPHGVTYAFCKAASQYECFFDEIKPRDTLTLLRALIPTTGLDDMVQVRSTCCPVPQTMCL